MRKKGIAPGMSSVFMGLVFTFFAQNALGQAPIANPATVLPEPENTAERCRDGRDNDSDDRVDCADPDCSLIVFCAVPGAHTPSLKIELSYEKLPHIQRTLLASDLLNLASFVLPLTSLVLNDIGGDAGKAVTFSLLSAGTTSAMTSSVLGSSAMTAWQSRFVRSNYDVDSGPKAASWVLTSLVIGSNIAWWVLSGLVVNGRGSTGTDMAMAGIVVTAPILNTINNWLVRPRWKENLYEARPRS